MVRVKVPSTSANMGPGFDSLGVALGMYNTITVSETEGGFTVVTGRHRRIVPGNENNMIYRALNRVFDEVGYNPQGIRISQQSNIPVTRGLGSSSACIIGGMLGANVIAGRPLSYDKILDLAAEMEGHPDNVTPALYGGFCSAVYENGRVYKVSTKITEPVKFAVMFPDYPVATRESRKVVPDTFSKEDAIYNISRTGLLVSALMSGKLDLLKTACNDRMHQQYRKGYIIGIDGVFELAEKLGAYATYLSGSGPAVVSLVDSGNIEFIDGMNKYFENNLSGWKCRMLTIDNVGAVVCESCDR